jgi:FkbM family methyltransferase
MSFLKSTVRKALRFYLTHTPVIKGRYPLMMAVHKWASEPVTVKAGVKDRGQMILELEDSAQFPLYYNIYEWKDLPTLKTLLEGTDTILDIGGNIGQMALLFAKYSKRVLTFEPIPTLAKRIREQVALNALQNRVQVYDVALTNFTGKLPLQLPNSENGGNGSLIIGRDGGQGVIEVDAMLLDDLLERERIQKVDLIKVDVEGAELFVLQGMPKLLSGKNKPILILEMNSGMMKLAGYGPKEIMDILVPQGYECYEFVKHGLEGPIVNPQPKIENYCFLTAEHKQRRSIQKAIKKQLTY